jgi:hypothetical protein
MAVNIFVNPFIVFALILSALCRVYARSHEKSVLPNGVPRVGRNGRFFSVARANLASFWNFRANLDKAHEMVSLALGNAMM